MDLFTFLKPKNELEGASADTELNRPFVPDSMWVKCPGCGAMLLMSDIEENDKICTKCGYHFRLTARERIALLADKDSFKEFDADLKSKNIIDFPDYNRKLKSAKLKSGENESVVTGRCTMGGYDTVLCVMEPGFMMGSMGTVTGEKITRAFEYATENMLPVVLCTVSGGARMHEGIMSLMQMAKTSGAVKRHSDAGGLYITVLTDPTTGGVTASFASLGDIILAEPKVLVGFAGRRVIQDTIKQKLPDDFQTAEFLLESGFVDAIADRRSMRKTLSNILRLHNYKKIGANWQHG